MVRVVFDTNVYISALAFGGKPLELLIWAEVELFRLVTSKLILTELYEKLVGKFGWSSFKAQKVVMRILNVAGVVNAKVSVRASTDPDDNKILECALESLAEYIVTGDNHLLILKQFKNIRIVTPATFLKKELWK